MTQTTQALMVLSAETLAVKIGKTQRVLSVEAAAVRGGKMFQQFMAEQAFASAVRKAGTGMYRPALEILSFGVTASVVKALEPQAGQLWTKARILLLAEKVMERPMGKSGKWSGNQIKARAMARHLLDTYGEKASGPVVAEARGVDVDDEALESVTA